MWVLRNLLNSPFRISIWSTRSPYLKMRSESVPEFNGFGSGRLFDLQAKSSDVAEPSRDQNGLVARHLDDYASVNLKPSSNSHSSIEYPCLACWTWVPAGTSPFTSFRDGCYGLQRFFLAGSEPLWWKPICMSMNPSVRVSHSFRDHFDLNVNASTPNILKPSQSLAMRADAGPWIGKYNTPGASSVVHLNAAIAESIATSSRAFGSHPRSFNPSSVHNFRLMVPWKLHGSAMLGSVMSPFIYNYASEPFHPHCPKRPSFLSL